MKRNMIQYLGAAALVAALASPANAQETYQDTKLVENELNGTARYVGMGGAMEALGADISTISTNPAGIGLFRKGQVTVSAGFVSQGDAKTTFSYNGVEASIKGNKTNMSFDQIGVVLPMSVARNSYLNVGFSYHKSRNFDQILTAVGPLVNASQNKLSAIKYAMGIDEYAWNGVDAVYEGWFTETGVGGNKSMTYLNGVDYLFGQYEKGYIGEYDVNISGSINDRVYLGITLGVHDVNYRSNKFYTEDWENNLNMSIADQLKIDGTGFDVKAGVIYRPIEGSPFRIGAYIHTPVFYDLTQKAEIAGDAERPSGELVNGDFGSPAYFSATYDFKLNTPWKFGLSLGHTVGKNLALGATYEYADYGSIDNRIIDGGHYDGWFGDYYTTSSSDRAMNDHTKQTLKGVHPLKLGMEMKPISQLAVRLGYNYISSVFEEDGFRDGSISSPGTAYATSTDYTNWKATNRFTLGLGYQIGKWNIDLAYQYNYTNGEFYPFMSYDGDSNPEYNNVVSATDVSFKRHQGLLTLGYRF